MLNLHNIARVALLGMVVGGTVAAVTSHGKRLPTRKADCRPIVIAAVIESILIITAIWG